ncbi:sigma-54 interaction domain-containing protein [Caballeronia sp. 15711]|uniref:sigma-54 interaction domain-containing protein n=1 Tax=Caballeronia sp. 15711 TaxID=3391029 RepID=UPI0039E387DF
MQILSLPNLAEHAISIRAKALAFHDEKSRHLFERIQLIAPSDATVLVTGESGTGKELIARLIHTSSTRADRPFVAVNCGAFSETLLESELFGHERGSFTGAIDSRAGWFEAASGGTLFLDEVGDLPLSAQVKLLRVLQEREVTRLGSRKALPIDVRLVAATNVRLEEAVRAGNFREDLYYRLDVAKIALPPLRERPADIEPLTRHFIDLYSRRLSVSPGSISDTALQRLKAHPWPGNIRELENVIHHTLLIRRGPQIEASDLHFSSLGVRETAPVQPGQASHSRKPGSPDPRNDGAGHMSDLRAVLHELFDRNVPDLWQEIESTVFTMAYDYCDRNQLQTSRLLTLSRNIVRTRLIQLGLLSSKVDAG